ncbi:(E2-independent) E3 ubiquitin-conjugating enzyme FATS-like [Hippocampus zosterae]|uniref:(E2-independent) E3 ubiquitin-conjugating enzyme FATS-like n=1 Tax=Hippocampus zosterae TaxID=109293 RepID=UPI00223E1AB6|nr:(E2-independent) E3 ubiquitin-conjugating enzyme FATS-like [Hippocampus zosterae]
MRPNEGRQAHSAADGLAASGAAGNRTIAEGDSGLHVLIDGSIIPTSPPVPYRTCVRREVPPRCTSSVVFLDKLFSASLVAPDRSGAVQNARYKSTAFVQICSTSTKESSRVPGVAVLGDDDGKNWIQRGEVTSTHDRTEEAQQRPARSPTGREMDYCRFYFKTLEASPESLSLKEALELSRPDFITRSRARVRRMEQRRRRRRRRKTSPAQDGSMRMRRCTTPDPLSDNLFKPRERSISGREMQQRSRRMYNKLPEVERKKQEEEKRAVSQANRLRADLLKKRLLDYILQK